MMNYRLLSGTRRCDAVRLEDGTRFWCLVVRGHLLLHRADGPPITIRGHLAKVRGEWHRVDAQLNVLGRAA